MQTSQVAGQYGNSRSNKSQAQLDIRHGRTKGTQDNRGITHPSLNARLQVTTVASQTHDARLITFMTMPSTKSRVGFTYKDPSSVCKPDGRGTLPLDSLVKTSDVRKNVKKMAGFARFALVPSGIRPSLLLLIQTMLKSVVFLAAIVGTSTAASVPSCYSNCLSSAAQAVGCASDDTDCIKASDAFIDLARSCLEEKKCTERTSSDTTSVEHAISILSALDLIDEATISSNIDFTPYHSTRDLTGLSRIVPIEKRQTFRRARPTVWRAILGWVVRDRLDACFDPRFQCSSTSSVTKKWVLGGTVFGQ
ncbi:hypothetical protein CC1G_08282 [Coprinopsis cinerea okayama7|uniref:CFEM domain-containing protein n=1 Tax=Coprinopsis cinerea (strain Okayama-7 / 130 / ATCC MYA-4618 / FGSC 9003) TaxID=240176 RepID=A8PG36_COPC7|nr:hypothetical protein CC1G_08282 [Coprinopsis cinerea okayama7\|eukprot:XP_001841138.2 hypothetical protein CC1G_08282 [Coprinopsis cinerea okayama7\